MQTNGDSPNIFYETIKGFVVGIKVRVLVKPTRYGRRPHISGRDPDFSPSGDTVRQGPQGRTSWRLQGCPKVGNGDIKPGSRRDTPAGRFQSHDSDPR
jgi:hypothetical protein